MNTPPVPNAKFDNLVVQEFADEILIYNLKTNKAYSLNETSTLVWRNCDGSKDTAEIAAAVSRELRQPVPEDLVWLALDNLKKEGLVKFDGDESAIFKGFNRRDVIKKVGLMTMAALPLLVSITAPSAANAQSGTLACTDCIVDLGIDNRTGELLGFCPELCSNLMCTCFGNNSCMGVGQLVEGLTCDQCRTVDLNAMNNSWRCAGIPA